mmetsp:Transcript_29451/g.53423  ORF Transcript_29451/g.53423 Transcript_29451/m.53423 type:complete len:121 (+) Transcript_29451:190-552(+)
MNMGRPHGSGDAVHKSSMYDTPEVNHNLAWQEPHVKLGVDISKLTSFDAVVTTRQSCDCFHDIDTDIPLLFTDIQFQTPLPWPPRKYCRDCAAFTGAVGGRDILGGAAVKFEDNAATGSG